jgi:hypothetical protein
MKKVFRYKAVYYLAIIASFLLLFFSFKALISLSDDYNIVKLLFVPLALILNLFSFICLIRKYKRTILFLNISLCLFIVLTARATITDILTHGLSLQYYNSYKYFLSFLGILIIVNIYKVKNIKSESEIDSIGRTHND